MKNKKITYASAGIFVFLLIGSLFAGYLKISGKSVVEVKNPELEKYRAENIPEDCRLPEYETNVKSWKEHLSHHQNTLYCLKYYQDTGKSK